MKLITFTETETTSPAEETVTTTAPAEETVTATTVAPEETVSTEETITKETELSSSSSAPVLTIGAVSEGENVLLFAEEITAETTAATEAAASITFQPKNFVDNLQYMGTGMLTIFIVIGVIILATSAINKIFSKKKD